MFVSGSRQTAEGWRLGPGTVSSWQQEGMQQSMQASHTYAHVFLIVNTCNLSRSLPPSLLLSLQVSRCLLWIVQLSSTPTRVDFAVAQLTALTVSWLTLWLPLIAVTVRLSLAFPHLPYTPTTRYPFPFNFCSLHCTALRSVSLCFHHHCQHHRQYHHRLHRQLHRRRRHVLCLHRWRTLSALFAGIIRHFSPTRLTWKSPRHQHHCCCYCCMCTLCALCRCCCCCLLHSL